MNDSFSLNESSCIYLSNALNEVLNGFSVDYESLLGTSRENVLHLFQKLRSMCDQKALLSQPISPEEATLLWKCSNLCLEEFDDGEFETRLGEVPEVARKLNNALPHL